MCSAATLPYLPIATALQKDDHTNVSSEFTHNYQCAPRGVHLGEALCLVREAQQHPLAGLHRLCCHDDDANCKLRMRSVLD